MVTHYVHVCADVHTLYVNEYIFAYSTHTMTV